MEGASIPVPFAAATGPEEGEALAEMMVIVFLLRLVGRIWIKCFQIERGRQGLAHGERARKRGERIKGRE